jgi:hypothetical protein
MALVKSEKVVSITRLPRSELVQQILPGPVSGAMPSPNCSPLQMVHAAWLEALPNALEATATAAALQAIVDLDIESLAAIDPPTVTAATDET